MFSDAPYDLNTGLFQVFGHVLISAYQTFDNFSCRDLNTCIFRHQTHVHDLNTGLVWFSDSLVYPRQEKTWQHIYLSKKYDTTCNLRHLYFQYPNYQDKWYTEHKSMCTGCNQKPKSLYLLIIRLNNEGSRCAWLVHIPQYLDQGEGHSGSNSEIVCNLALM